MIQEIIFKASIELEEIDANCNNCRHMIRDLNKFKSFDKHHQGQEKASHRVNYGKCNKLDKSVSFIPNTCQLDTQNCFEHRRNNKPNHIAG